MPENPTDPETLDEFPDDGGEPDLEAPEADAAEQRRELLRLRDTPPTPRTLESADPADAAEQSRVVDPGDEEYR